MNRGQEQPDPIRTISRIPIRAVGPVLCAIVIAVLAAAVSRPMDYYMWVLPRAVLAPDLLAHQPLSVVTSIWLHNGLDHVLYNLSWILLFGWRVERLHGALGTVAISLVGGTLAQLIFPAVDSSGTFAFACGSSGAALALVGAMFERRLFSPESLSPFERNPLVGLAVAALVGAVLAGGDDSIRWVHAGGLVAGIALSAGFGSQHGYRLRNAVGGIVIALHAVAVGSCASRVLLPDPVDMELTSRWLFGRVSDDAKLTNNLSWCWAIRSNATPEVLQVARERMEAVVDAIDPSIGPINSFPLAARDTLALLRYRTDDLVGAVSLEREVVGEAPELKFVSRLSRFERTLLAALSGDGTSGSRWVLSRSDGALGLTPVGRATKSGSFLPGRALVLRGDQLVGYLEASPGQEGVGIVEPAGPVETVFGAEVRLVPLPGARLAASGAVPPSLWWMASDNSSLISDDWFCRVEDMAASRLD